jgi:predicted amidohydrolase YtcJ
MDRLAALVMVGVLAAMAAASSAGPGASRSPRVPARVVSDALSGAGVADLVLTGGRVVTMDEAQPVAQAVAIRGDTILMVGGSDAVLAHQGPTTVVIGLGGRVVMPGFVDSHQHRIGDRGKLGIEDPDEVIGPAVRQGWTTIHELYVDQGRLDELRALDAEGRLPLRVEAWLAVNENSPEGRSLGDWYTAFRPGEQVSPHVRIAGLKAFTDYDDAQVLLWRQRPLERYLSARHAEGWQVATKTVSTRSLRMILRAHEAIAQDDPSVVRGRHRLEHMLFATPAQLRRIRELGLLPSIQTNMPGELVGDPGIEALIDREPNGSYTPWRSLVELGIPFANGSAFPSYHVDEPSGTPFGSPMRLVWQAVTRAGNLRARPGPELLDQAITGEDALRGLTIDAAYAAFQDHRSGSVAVGKLADLVVLSEDPLGVSTDAIPDIGVLVTLVSGRAVWCAPEAPELCPPA